MTLKDAILEGIKEIDDRTSFENVLFYTKSAFKISMIAGILTASNMMIQYINARFNYTYYKLLLS